MPEQTCVIVGASHAGTQLALSLRQGSWEGRIVLAGDAINRPGEFMMGKKLLLADDSIPIAKMKTI